MSKEAPISQAKVVAERDALVDALANASGNRKHAAGMLGVTKRQVIRLLKKYPDVAERFPGTTGRPPASAPKPTPRSFLRARPPLASRFEAFHAAHPEVYRTLVRLTRAEVARGRSPGISMIWEVMRWRLLGRSRRLRLNNDWRSRYARLIRQQEPDLANVFRTRKLRA